MDATAEGMCVGARMDATAKGEVWVPGWMLLLRGRCVGARMDATAEGEVRGCQD